MSQGAVERSEGRGHVWVVEECKGPDNGVCAKESVKREEDSIEDFGRQELRAELRRQISVTLRRTRLTHRGKRREEGSQDEMNGEVVDVGVKREGHWWREAKQ